MLHKRYGKKKIDATVLDNVVDNNINVNAAAVAHETLGTDANISNKPGRGSSNKRIQSGEKRGRGSNSKGGRDVIDISESGGRSGGRTQRVRGRGAAGAAGKQTRVQITKARQKAKTIQESDSSDSEFSVLSSEHDELNVVNVQQDAFKKKKPRTDTAIMDAKPVTTDSKDKNTNEMIAVMEQLRKSEEKISELNKLLLEKSTADKLLTEKPPTDTIVSKSSSSQIEMSFMTNASAMQMPKIINSNSKAMSDFMFQSGCNFQRTVMLEEELESLTRKVNREALQRAYLQSIQKLFE